MKDLERKAQIPNFEFSHAPWVRRFQFDFFPLRIIAVSHEFASAREKKRENFSRFLRFFASILLLIGSEIKEAIFSLPCSSSLYLPHCEMSC